MAVSIGVGLLVGYAVYQAVAATIPDIPDQFREDKVSRILNTEYSVPVAYGEARLDGNIVFYSTSGTNNKYLDVVIVVAEGEIEGFNKVYMDGDALPLFDAGAGNTFTHGTQISTSHPLFGALKASGDLNLSNVFILSTTVFNINGVSVTPGVSSVADLVTWLNASGDPVISLCTYSVTSSGKLHIEYDVSGSAGNTFFVDYSSKGPFGLIKYGSVRLSGGNDTLYAYGYFYNGTDAQTANAALVSAYPPVGSPGDADYDSGWTSSHTLSGFAYVYIRLDHNPDLFSGSIPTFSFELKGKKCYDPRTATTIYSENPAVCLRDYLTNTRYGKGLDSALIDSASIVAAANDCEVARSGFDVTGAPTTYDTYTVGGSLETDKPVKDNVAYLLQAMNATLPYYDGTFYLKILKAGNPVITFDSSNIIGQVSLSSSTKRNRLNKVSVTFPDKERHYKKGDAVIDPVNVASSYYSAKAAAYLAEDNAQILEKRVDAPLVNYYPRAADLAELTMNLSRRGLTASFTTTLVALQAVPGDIVGLTYDLFGFSNKEFRLESIVSRLDGLCDVVLSEHDDTFYTLEDKTGQAGSSESTLTDPRSVAKPEIDSCFSDSTTILTTIDGQVQPRIYVSWTNLDVYPNLYYIYLKETNASQFTKVAEVTKDDVLEYYITGVNWNTAYDVGVAVENNAGYVSSIAISGCTVPNPLSGAAYNYPDVSGLELIGEGTNAGQGNSTNFTGKDIKLQWRLNSSNVTFEFGSALAEQMGAVGGVVPFTLTGYKIEVYHPSDINPRQEYIATQPNFTYSLDKNIEDGSGTPARTVAFKLRAEGQVAGTGVTGISETPAVITVTNPAPALPSNVVLSKGFQNIVLSYDRPAIADWSGILVWMSTSSGFTPSASNLVYSGVDNKIVLSGLTTGTTYYIRYALTDTFVPASQTDTTSLTVSAETSITTDTAVTSSEIQSLIADKIAAGTLGEAVALGGVFVASGTEAVLNGTGPALGTYRLDMGPVAHTGSTYVLNYYNGYDDAHGSYDSKFSIDESGNALFSGGIYSSLVSGSNLVGSTLQAGSIVTKGSFLTTALSGGETTITVVDATDFTTSGSGWISDSTNQDDAFSWTGKSGNNLTGCSGVLAHAAGAVVIPTAQTMYVDSSIGELEFYADRGDGTIENLASLGVNQSGSDYIVANFGSTSSGNNRRAINASSYSAHTIYSTSWTGAAIIASSNSGYGVSTSSSSNLALYAFSDTNNAVWAISNSAIGVRANGATYDFYASGAGTNYGPFTGGHDGLILKGSVIEQGDIVCDGEKFFNEGLSQTIGETLQSTRAYDCSVIGVFNSQDELIDDKDKRPAGLKTYSKYKSLQKKYNRAIFNALGEGMINVCGESGDIEAGDLIVSSNIPGKGMKQDDNIIRNYTVAKARQSVKLKSKDEVKQIPCIYLCG